MALGAAISSLSEWTADDDSNVEEIADELERAFLISLFITLTSHTFLSEWGREMEAAPIQRLHHAAQHLVKRCVRRDRVRLYG